MQYSHFSFRRLFISATLVWALLLGGMAPNARAQTSTLVASLKQGRASHTATLLGNGKVLVAGGTYKDLIPLSSCELYDARKKTWSAAPSLKTARLYHTATLLRNGKVLVVGGVGSSNNSESSSELYDPRTNQWSALTNLKTARQSHTATLLDNGKVLITGGMNTSGDSNQGFNILASVELYDPRNNTWGTARSLKMGVSITRRLCSVTARYS